MKLFEDEPGTLLTREELLERAMRSLQRPSLEEVELSIRGTGVLQIDTISDKPRVHGPQPVSDAMHHYDLAGAPYNIQRVVREIEIICIDPRKRPVLGLFCKGIPHGTSTDERYVLGEWYYRVANAPVSAFVGSNPDGPEQQLNAQPDLQELDARLGVKCFTRRASPRDLLQLAANVGRIEAYIGGGRPTFGVVRWNRFHTTVGQGLNLENNEMN